MATIIPGDGATTSDAGPPSDPATLLERVEELTRALDEERSERLLLIEVAEERISIEREAARERLDEERAAREAAERERDAARAEAEAGRRRVGELEAATGRRAWWRPRSRPRGAQAGT